MENENQNYEKTHALTEETSPSIIFYHKRSWAKKVSNEPNYNTIVSSSYWLIRRAKTDSSCFIPPRSAVSSKPLPISNKGIQWTLDEIQLLTVKDLVTNFTVSTNCRISSHEIPLPDWHLLLSQSQEFLGDQLELVPITGNQQGAVQRR